jgi:hypothetical protein
MKANPFFPVMPVPRGLAGNISFDHGKSLDLFCRVYIEVAPELLLPRAQSVVSAALLGFERTAQERYAGSE